MSMGVLAALVRPFVSQLPWSSADRQKSRLVVLLSWRWRSVLATPTSDDLLSKLQQDEMRWQAMGREELTGRSSDPSLSLLTDTTSKYVSPQLMYIC